MSTTASGRKVAAPKAATSQRLDNKAEFLQRVPAAAVYTIAVSVVALYFAQLAAELYVLYRYFKIVPFTDVSKLLLLLYICAQLLALFTMRSLLRTIPRLISLFVVLYMAAELHFLYPGEKADDILIATYAMGIFFAGGLIAVAASSRDARLRHVRSVPAA